MKFVAPLIAACAAAFAHTLSPRTSISYTPDFVPGITERSLIAGDLVRTKTAKIVVYGYAQRASTLSNQR